MTKKSALTILALIITPFAAIAQDGCHERMQQSASQCATGLTWDAATQTCVTPTSS